MFEIIPAENINKIQSLRNELVRKSQPLISVWGDSLLRGVVLDHVAGRYHVLNESVVTLCSQALKVTIENFSKFGCTVIKAKQRLFQHLDMGKKCDVVILEYGGNDCDLQWEEVAANPEQEHLPKIPINIFSSNIQELIDTLVSRSIIPLLTTLPPLHPDRYLDWICRKGLCKESILRYLGDVHYIYRHHERYSQEINRLAVDNGCRIVDVRASFLERMDYQELLCEDGIHPNDQGHRLIYETFMSFVNRYMPTMRLQTI